MTATEQFKLAANALRQHILNDGNAVKDLKTCELLKDDLPVARLDKGEVMANIMLAYRHLEDARMRLGKAIQAMDGGVSCYDKQPISNPVRRLTPSEQANRSGHPCQ